MIALLDMEAKVNKIVGRIHRDLRKKSPETYDTHGSLEGKTELSINDAGKKVTHMGNQLYVRFIPHKNHFHID